MNDSITIIGVNKLMYLGLGIFAIITMRDLVSQWLQNQRFFMNSKKQIDVNQSAIIQQPTKNDSSILPTKMIIVDNYSTKSINTNGPSKT